MIRIGIFILILLQSVCWGQSNLIPNPGFELNDSCPLNLDQFTVKDWYSTLGKRTTPDYFSLCGGKDAFSSPANYIVNIKPPEGEAFAGLVGYNPKSNYREYMSVSLTEPLKKGKIYTFKISLSQPEMSLFYISDLGVAFTKEPFDLSKVGNYLILEPSISIHSDKLLKLRNAWTHYSIDYIAKGGEREMHFGCFTSDENLRYLTYSDRRNFCNRFGYSDAYYLIDNMSLSEKEIVSVDYLDLQKIDSIYSTTPIRIITFSDVKFNTGEYVGNAEEFLQFDALIEYLKNTENTYILIEGHTDDEGAADDNQLLSERRAAFVSDYFENKGIEKIKLRSSGYGEALPMVENDSAKNRSLNRRVVVKLYK
jgi:outer membrane protein OmpA-like peptidoglycan-associated protein